MARWHVGGTAFHHPSLYSSSIHAPRLLGPPSPQAIKDGLRATESDPAAREGLLQLLARVGSRLRGHDAHLLTLAILVMELAAPAPSVRALAAELLTGAWAGAWEWGQGRPGVAPGRVAALVVGRGAPTPT